MPCSCVLREIFRICYRKFRQCASREYLGRVSFERARGPQGRLSWGFKDAEYCADFILVSRRHLHPFEYQLFNYHFLLGADWKLCCRRLKMERGNFFHAVYRIEQRLGRAYRETWPYGLWPTEEYFR